MDKYELEMLLKLLIEFDKRCFSEDDGSSEHSDLHSTIELVKSELEVFE